MVLYHFDMAAAQAPAFRRFLARTLTASLGNDSGRYPRGARRVEHLRRALGDAPLREEVRERLVASLSLVAGIGALIATRDVLGLDRATARGAVAASAEEILDVHLARGG